MFDWDIKSQSRNLEELKDNLLKTRNIGDLDEFLNPSDPVSLIHLFPENLIENIKKSKDIIYKSISMNMPIIIHGDYDADGVISTYILHHTIKEILKYPNTHFFIPDRFEDGYGLSDKTLKKILEMFPNEKLLLITVDCGITSINQVSFLKSEGHLVIITDHHHQGEELPNSDALIWSDKVVGSSLSWFLSLALGNKNPQMITLAATATITDVFPLKGFNRSLVKSGIDIFKKNPFYPFKKLLSTNNVSPEDLEVYHLGFVIGPRLNSSGRIAGADLSVSLLASSVDNEIEKVLSEINMINQRRQKITEESVSKHIFDKDSLPKVIVLRDEEFHEGIVGLIASKIVQTYHRPALVITRNEGFLKGSARSIKGINIIEIIKKFNHFLKGSGGHELAAGFSLEKDNFEPFKLEIEKYINENIPDEVFIKKQIIDSEIDLDLINFETIEFIKNFEPYGPENTEPIFLTRGFVINEIKKIGQQKNHLSLKLINNGKDFKALSFSYPAELDRLYLGQKIDLVFKMKKNTFNNIEKIDLHVLDVRESV